MAEPKAKKSSQAVKVKKTNKIVRWWKETIGELRKVTWPTKEDAWRMTKTVLVVVVLMAVFLGVVDFIFSSLVGFVIG